MSIQRLNLRNVGQIGHADIEFGDLTVLVGQQATGKTVFLDKIGDRLLFPRYTGLVGRRISAVKFVKE